MSAATTQRQDRAEFESVPALQPAELRFARLLAFVAPALPMGALGVPLSLYLPAHYSSYVGLSLAVVGFAFFLVRVLDIGFDPLMGLLLDRTRTRWGQCRPWMVVGGIFLALGALMLFLAPPGSSAAYLVIGLLVVYAGSSMLGLAHPAWAARLAPRYDERSRVYAWIHMTQSLGTFLILGAPTAFAFLKSMQAGGEVHAMGWGLALTMMAGLLLALASVPEPQPPPNSQKAASTRASLKDYLWLMTRPAVARLVIADAVTVMGVGTSTSLFIFFWRCRGLSGPNTSLLVLIYLAACMMGVPLWMMVARRIGKHRALIGSCFGFLVIFPFMGVLPADRMDILAPALAVFGLAFAGQYLIRAMAADAADEARLHSGLDHTGQVYALLTSTAKAGPAVMIAVAYSLLDHVGFRAAEGAANTPHAVHTLYALYLGFPEVAMLCGALVFFGYKLDAAEHARVRAKLDSLDRVSLERREN